MRTHCCCTFYKKVYQWYRKQQGRMQGVRTPTPLRWKKKKHETRLKSFFVSPPPKNNPWPPLSRSPVLALRYATRALLGRNVKRQRCLEPGFERSLERRCNSMCGGHGHLICDLRFAPTVKRKYTSVQTHSPRLLVAKCKVLLGCTHVIRRTCW